MSEAADTEYEQRDSAKAARPSWTSATVEWGLAQAFPWAWNYYVRKAEFAHLTGQSIETNLQPASWTWDDNNFKTNQFAHPYHGMLYFSAFRSTGHSFWTASAATLSGSLVWETMMETHPPAPNDFINTSLGGIALGEVTTRLSRSLLNRRRSRHLSRTMLAFAINPLNTFNTLTGVRGAAGPGRASRDDAMLVANVDAGIRRFGVLMNEGGRAGMDYYLRAVVQYGDPFRDTGEPFANFNLACEWSFSDSVRMSNLRVEGLLWSHSLSVPGSTDLYFNLTMNYDFIRNAAIQYGAQSFNAKLMSRLPAGRKVRIFAEVGVTAIALAAVPDDYMYYGEGRNYDYGPGGGFFLGTRASFANRLWCGVHIKGFWFTTHNGNESSFFMKAVGTDLRYLTPSGISVGLQVGELYQKGMYALYPNTLKREPFVRMAVGYMFGR